MQSMLRKYALTHVFLEIAFLNEAPLADVALPRLLPAMKHQVVLQ